MLQAKSLLEYPQVEDVTIFQPLDNQSNTSTAVDSRSDWAPKHQLHLSDSTYSTLKVALAHDWRCGVRGGEHVLADMARSLLEAGAVITRLYVMFDDHRPLVPALDSIAMYCSKLGRLPLASTKFRKHLLPLYPLAVADISNTIARDCLDDQKRPHLVISTSSAAIKGINLRKASTIAGNTIPHISYIHTPARYLWGQQEQYTHGEGGMLRSIGLTVMGPVLRRWDKASAQNPTLLLANSTHTRSLISSAWGRESNVLFPGVRTHRFTPPLTPAERDGSWLVVSALEPYKRVDLAIKAASIAGAQLTIVGDGSQRAALELLAQQYPACTITFTGRISDDAIATYYRKAGVFLYPQVEDFGITAVEAQSAGLPVAALGKGGVLDTVIDKVTGVSYYEQNAESLAAAAIRCVEMSKQPETAAACRAHATKFSREQFASGFMAYVQAILRT